MARFAYRQNACESDDNDDDDCDCDYGHAAWMKTNPSIYFAIFLVKVSIP